MFPLLQMYGLIWLTQMPSKVQDCDILVMLTSALCHDLDHPGYNNAYQVSVSRELKQRRLQPPLPISLMKKKPHFGFARELIIELRGGTVSRLQQVKLVPTMILK